MKMKQATHIPTVSAFLHALGRDDIRHPLIEVIHLDDLADCSSFGNTRYTFGFYCVVYKGRTSTRFARGWQNDVATHTDSRIS